MSRTGVSRKVGVLAGAITFIFACTALLSAPARADDTASPDEGAAADRGAAATRIYGKSRYETSMEVYAMDTRTNVPLILATGEDFADGLSAGALAAASGGKLLLIRPGLQDQMTIDAMNATKPSWVYVIGGTGAISDRTYAQIKEQVKSRTPGAYQRLSGVNRYETSLAVAYWHAQYAGVRGAVIVRGSNFPDALAAASLAGVFKAPVILVDQNTDRLGNTLRTRLRAAHGHEVLYLLGGGWKTSFVSDLDAFSAGFEHLSGVDRWETNRQVLAERATYGAAGMEEALVVNGTRFPDALAVSGYAALNALPVVLAQQDCIPAGALTFAQAAGTRWVLGGPTVLTDNVMALGRC